MSQAWTSVEDLRKRARRRLPRFAFDFIDGGAGDEGALRRNRAAFERTTVTPRVLRNVDGDLTTATDFLGKTWNLPFGVAPIGMAGIAWPGIDGWLAAAAEAHGAPYTASTPGTTSLEDLHAAAPNSAWFQLYVAEDERIVADLMARAEAVGYGTMLVTVDVPKPGKRVRDIRNRFILPLRPSARLAWDVLAHPEWSLAVLRHGTPRFRNLERYTSSSSANSLAQFMASQSSGRLDWTLFSEIRKAWKGKLVVKGVLAPEDAVQAAEYGADAVAVSNHGGRQLGSAPASLHALGPIRQAVGPDFPLLVDGGIRSGEDVLKALIAGADFCLLGRAFVFAVGSYGEQGASRIFDLLRGELVNAMAQIGLRELAGRHEYRESLLTA